MSGIFRFLLILCLLVSVSFTLSAQEIVLESDTLSVYFKVGSHEYDPSYMGNESRMEKFVKDYVDKKGRKISGITYDFNFNVTYSPEGRYEINRELSEKRAETLERYLLAQEGISDSVIVVSHIAEAWDGLIEMLKVSDMRWRDDVLDIIENTPQILVDEQGRISEPRKDSLMAYQNGRPWRYMLRNWFPELRKLSVVMQSELQLPDLGEAEVEDYDVPFDELTVDDHRPTVSLMPTWKRELTLKTNAIGWGMGHANVAAEIDLAPHWSLSVPFYYSGGIDYFTSGIKFRGIVIQPEARYYFKGNDGLYVGVHLGVGWYNFALNGDYRIQDHDGTRPAWGGGLGVGYSLQFRKFPKWGMEFSLGAGVYDVLYDTFYNEPNGPYAQKGVHDTFVGIDNVSVAFTYKFLQNRKEGRR